MYTCSRRWSLLEKSEWLVIVNEINRQITDSAHYEGIVRNSAQLILPVIDCCYSASNEVPIINIAFIEQFHKAFFVIGFLVWYNALFYYILKLLTTYF